LRGAKHKLKPIFLQVSVEFITAPSHLSRSFCCHLRSVSKTSSTCVTTSVERVPIEFCAADSRPFGNAKRGLAASWLRLLPDRFGEPLQRRQRLVVVPDGALLTPASDHVFGQVRKKHLAVPRDRNEDDVVDLGAYRGRPRRRSVIPTPPRGFEGLAPLQLGKRQDGRPLSVVLGFEFDFGIGPSGQVPDIPDAGAAQERQSLRLDQLTSIEGEPPFGGA